MSNDTSMVRVELPDVDETIFPIGSPLADLSVHLELAGRQSGRAIQFTLELSNPSSSAIRILNPLDMMQIVLVGPDGMPEELKPATPPRVFINTKGPLEMIRPYSIVGVANTRRATSEAETSDEVLELPAKSVHRLTLRIDQVRPGGTRTQLDPNATKALAKGTHQLRVVVPVISRDGDDRHKMFSSEAIPVDLS